MHKYSHTPHTHTQTSESIFFWSSFYCNYSCKLFDVCPYHFCTFSRLKIFSILYNIPQGKSYWMKAIRQYQFSRLSTNSQLDLFWGLWRGHSKRCYDAMKPFHCSSGCMFMDIPMLKGKPPSSHKSSVKSLFEDYPVFDSIYFPINSNQLQRTCWSKARPLHDAITRTTVFSQGGVQC